MTEYKTQDDRWLVFYDHPRMASTAIRDALDRSPGSVMHHASHAPLPGYRVNDRATIRSRELRDIATKFCVARDPRDVMASWHAINAGRGLMQTIPELVRLFPNQHRQYCPNGRILYFEPMCDVVLCYERLDEDWQRLAAEFDLAPLARVNETNNKTPWRQLLSTSDELAIVTAFCADFCTWKTLRFAQ